MQFWRVIEIFKIFFNSLVWSRRWTTDYQQQEYWSDSSFELGVYVVHDIYKKSYLNLDFGKITWGLDSIGNHLCSFIFFNRWNGDFNFFVRYRPFAAKNG